MLAADARDHVARERFREQDDHMHPFQQDLVATYSGMQNVAERKIREAMQNGEFDVNNSTKGSSSTSTRRVTPERLDPRF